MEKREANIARASGFLEKSGNSDFYVKSSYIKILVNNYNLQSLEVGGNRKFESRNVFEVHLGQSIHFTRTNRSPERFMSPNF